MPLLGVAAAGSAWASGLPQAWRIAVALACLGEGLRLAWRNLRQPAFQFTWPGPGQAATLAWANGGQQRLDEVELAFRGPMAMLRGRDGRGRVVRIVWYPDVLPAASRRALRLVAGVPAIPAADSHRVAG